MTYRCEIIGDLLPLYIDGACSGESRKAVEEHLPGCEKCRKYYEQMKSANDFCSIKRDDSEDIKMAQSLKNIKGRIAKKRIAASVISVAAVIAILFGTISVLKSIKCDIVYDNNISVTDSLPVKITFATDGKYTDGKYLSAQIIGHKVLYTTQKRVELKKGDDTEVRIYFYTSTSKWEEALAGEETVSYHLITPIDEDNDVDKIFYYIGDYTNLENMSEQELDEIDKKSTLLWNK